MYASGGWVAAAAVVRILDGWVASFIRLGGWWGVEWSGVATPPLVLEQAGSLVSFVAPPPSTSLNCRASWLLLFLASFVPTLLLLHTVWVGFSSSSRGFAAAAAVLLLLLPSSLLPPPSLSPSSLSSYCVVAQTCSTSSSPRSRSRTSTRRLRQRCVRTDRWSERSSGSGGRMENEERRG